MKYGLFLAVFVQLFGAGGLAATEREVAVYGSILDTCYQQNANPGACIGLMASACSSTEEGGQTTLGITTCNQAEAQRWDTYLNAEYQQVVARAKASDAGERAEFAVMEQRLREAQRAWITFRDTECAFAYAIWGSGSMRNIEASHCVLRVTAERTLRLRQIREMFQ